MLERGLIAKVQTGVGHGFSMRHEGLPCVSYGTIGLCKVANLPFAVKIGVKPRTAKQRKTRNVLRGAGLSGDADRARTDDLLRDRHFRSMCAVVRRCAPGRADVAVMRGCPDLLVCHLCAQVRRRGCELVSNLVSKNRGYAAPLRDYLEGVFCSKSLHLSMET